MKLEILGNKKVDIQKGMIGIFFEDINYGADGGLYAEMIENRSFEFLDARGDKDAYYQKFDGLYGWSAKSEASKTVLEIREKNPLNEINPHYLHVSCDEGGGFTNKAYDGIFLRQGQGYRISFYARSSKVKLQFVVLTKEKTTISLGSVQIDSTSWRKYELEFNADENVQHGVFTIIFEEEAEADFDCISMFPQDAYEGIFRKDLVDLLKELKPGFIRFPGGCVVEGNELSNRYQWKNSVGDVTGRKANWNRWAVHENCEENNFTSLFSHYNQTLGLGYYEYFLLCECVGAKPLPVANVGLACQYQSTQLVERGTGAYKEFIQDVLDLIEFANGNPSTKWGALRAKMGHSEPFNLEMIGIGNEQWQTDKVDFFERYDDFEKAIHEKYPDIKLINSAGPTVHTPTYDAAWENIYKKSENNSKYTYAVDEHYYMSPEWFLENTHFYDKYSRNVKVFSGEYAAHDRDVSKGELKNNWKSALAEAAFLTGVERNADVVYLASYAPLFARIGYTQWAPDLIWFDDMSSYGTPSFYVQKIYSCYTGTCTIESKLEYGEEKQIFHTVSYTEKTNTEKAKLYIKIVNASSNTEKLSIAIPENLKETLKIDSKFKVTKILLTGELQGVNSINNPLNIAPQEDILEITEMSEFEITVEAQSVIVLIV